MTQYLVIISSFLFLQLLGYPASISTMSGVISPTNLSLYSTPTMAVSSAHRSGGRSRWNTTITDDEFNLIPHSAASTNIENAQVILMEDCKYSNVRLKLVSSFFKSLDLCYYRDRRLLMPVTYISNTPICIKKSRKSTFSSHFSPESETQTHETLAKSKVSILAIYTCTVLFNEVFCIFFC